MNIRQATATGNLKVPERSPENGLNQKFEKVITQVFSDLNLPVKKDFPHTGFKELLNLQARLYRTNFTVEVLSKVGEGVASLAKKMGNF